jgi:hypothetical protein
MLLMNLRKKTSKQFEVKWQHGFLLQLSVLKLGMLVGLRIATFSCFVYASPVCSSLMLGNAFWGLGSAG